MMVNAIKQIIDIPTEIITFSDDMDGLRKVPDNIPNKEILKKNLRKKRQNYITDWLWSKWFTSYWNFCRSCKNYHDSERH